MTNGRFINISNILTSSSPFLWHAHIYYKKVKAYHVYKCIKTLYADMFKSNLKGIEHIFLQNYTFIRGLSDVMTFTFT